MWILWSVVAIAACLSYAIISIDSVLAHPGLIKFAL